MKKQGVTIIELLIVISVIAILMSIGFPMFKGMQDEAKIARAKSELKTIKAAIESYYIHNRPHAYPPATATVEIDYLYSAESLVLPSPIPYDPFGATTTTEYKYVISGVNGSFWYAASPGAGGVFEATAIDNTTGEISIPLTSDDILVTNGTDPDYRFFV